MFLLMKLKNFVNRHMPEIMQTTVAREDFASEAGGATVTCSLTTDCLPWPFSLWSSSPSLAITDGDRTGQCWLVRGQHAHLGVVLSQPIYPTHVTIEHVPIRIAADKGEAPRAMILWGLVDGENNVGRVKTLNIAGHQEPPLSGPLRRYADKLVPLAALAYDPAKGPSQTLPVHDYIRSSRMDFTTVVLEIRSNWGSERTCLYRIRIHGEPVVAG